MFRPVVAGVAALLVLTSVAAMPVGADQHNPRVQTPDGFDETTFRVTVHENGSATWAIEHRTPLENESEQRQFEDFASEFEENETDLYVTFVEQAGLLTQYGANATGREMTARNFQRSASADPVQSTGTVRMSFLWTNFARVEGDRVIVSDVFEGGFYVGSSQSLVFERGPALAFAETSPTPDSMSQPDSLGQSVSVTYNGEQSFDDRRPYVEYAPRSAVGGGEETQAGTPAPETSQESAGGVWLMAVVALVVALGVGGAIAWRSGAAATVLDSFGGDEAPADPVSSPDPSPEPEDPEPAVPDEELLTDSDRVRQLLEENGGRMKQVDIVDSTDWSKSKVSMLLSDMEEDGEISKLRVGRENIISLAGEEPDAAGSPFEDE